MQFLFFVLRTFGAFLILAWAHKRDPAESVNEREALSLITTELARRRLDFVQALQGLRDLQWPGLLFFLVIIPAKQDIMRLRRFLLLCNSTVLSVEIWASCIKKRAEKV